MEIREGFKKTEVGLIPVDWEIKTLNECCKKITDGTHDTPKPVKAGVPFITAIHVKENAIDFENCYFLPIEIHQIIYRRCNPQKHDVLMVNIGAGVATTALINVDYEFSLKNVALLKPDNSSLSGAFLNYWQSKEKVKIINTTISGGAQPFLSLGQIEKLKIALPSISEQTTIATALSDMDALISSLEKLIEKKKAIKQGAMQELLRSKDGWVDKKLGDVCKIYGRIGFRGYTVNDIVTENEGAISLSPSNFNNGKLIFNKCTYISWKKYDESPEIKLKIGDIVLVKTASIGKTAIVKELPCAATLNPQIVVLKNICIDNLFLSYLMNYDTIQKQIKDKVVGGVVPTLSQEQIANFKISIPKSEEQTYIANILSDMDSNLSILESRLSKYKWLKQAMMQNLLTGKIRLV